MIPQKYKNKIISLNVDQIGYPDAISKIITIARERKSGYICFSNVHMTIEAYRDEKLAEQINNASLVLADGVPIVTMFRFFYGQRQERIAGMDAMPDLIRAAASEGLKLYFFGSTPEILDKIITRTRDNYPEAKIAGYFSPPFDSSVNDESHINRINNSGAHLIFVALGCPKQEKWMATHSHKIHAVLLGVGGAFPLYAGITKRAPLWLRKLSLEWLFRLAQEPSRMFKRYLITNSLFVYLVMKTKVKFVFKSYKRPG